MQLLAEKGNEGAIPGSYTRGLGLIKGEVINLKNIGIKLKLPHIGWNEVNLLKDDILIRNIPTKTDFYFVHNYVYSQLKSVNVLATANYDKDFPVIVNDLNVWGTQFHPEKSSIAGKILLKNFLNLS